MATYSIYQVDAFARVAFTGNPAAVVPLQAWLPDAVMQAIAMENNLAETAYFVPRVEGGYDLRWFTPEIEIPLCGHATLASGYVLYEYLGYSDDIIRFYSQSGELTVQRAGDKLALDFPARPLNPVPKEENGDLWQRLTAILGTAPIEIFHSVNNYMAVFDKEETVRRIQPNMAALNEMSGLVGVIITAPAGSGTTNNARHDCVSRYFAPQAGVPEDPVTGSAHCSIVPYWSDKLGKQEIYAYQASARGGELFCEYRPSSHGKARVIMAGYVAPYMKGVIEI